MNIDARTLPKDVQLDCDICVVGAGAAGISLALGLLGSGLRVVLIEAGGLKPDAKSQDFYEGEVMGAAHSPPHMYRQRRLGGSTTIWGGRCVPYDAEDFTRRDHVPLSGWPFGRESLIPFYQRAQRLLEVGDFDYAASTALRAGEFIDGFSSPDIDTDSIERYSPPVDMWKRHGRALSRDERLRVIANAACVGLDRTDDGGAIDAARFATAPDRQFTVCARAYVLAVGGLETARLLLASNIGNHSDYVGRTYMCHVEGAIGQLRLTPANRPVQYGFVMTRDGVYARRRLMLSAERRRTLGLLNAMVRLHHPNVVDPAHGHGVLSAMFLAKSFIIPEFRRKLSMVEHASVAAQPQNAAFWGRHLGNLALGAPAVAGFLARWLTTHTLAYRKLPYVALPSRAGVYPLDFNGEQAPDPDSRVTLSDRRDGFGVPRLKIDWRLNELDVRTLAETLRALRDGFARSGCGVIAFDDAALEDQARTALPVGGHHIGTARMAASPAQGVVDADARVHYVANLHLAGPAVFPTSSHANPTLTIVAMALRLADHLKGAIQ